ncbi:MAG TPA: hypothetical protein VE569_04260, partial [Acidimicrobiia bacterium]|nr:hypothetical protein [Acidimicrobiia bacterium]
MAEGFAIRHRNLTLALWAHVPILAVIGLKTEVDLVTIVSVCLVVIALAVGGMLLRGTLPPASSVALGLTVSACGVVNFSGEVATAHLYFPVVLVAVGYYRLIEPLLATLGGMGFYHLIV